MFYTSSLFSLSISQPVNSTHPESWVWAVCKHSATTCRITHLFPLTVTEKQSQVFYQNMWVFRPLESMDDEQSWFCY